MKIVTDQREGDLMTRPSTDEAGHSNFAVCRDWRRELDQIVRREGDRLLQPKSGSAGNQATPNFPDTDEAITLIFTARKDNGKSALIVGTPTTLWRFWAFEDNAILAAGIVAAGVVGTIATGEWLVIGSGFDAVNGRRWEAKNVGGLTVFNNGNDLPCSYDLNEFAVRPIYELREQGVAYVGTIEEIAGMLVCGDIGQIHADYLEVVMDNVGYGAFNVGQESHIDRVHYDVMWSDPTGPLRWGASAPGTIAAGSRILSLGYDLASWKPGDAVRVVGAGEDGGDLITTLGYKSGATTWILGDLAVTAVSEAAVALGDAASLAVGHFPLLDDSTAVVRLLKIQDRLLVAKADGFVIGEYTGNAALPFVFQRVYSGTEAVHWRWSLIELNGEAIYAGATEFYSFNLIGRRPKQHPRLTLCSDIFFAQVASAAQDAVFAVDNGITKEVWFVFPSATDDKALAYDYRARELGGDRCSTIGEAYSAGATIERPAAGITYGPAEKWFVLGLSSGTLVQYLRDRLGPLGWTRRGSDYESTFWSGWAAFGDEYREKQVTGYTLLLSSQSLIGAGGEATVRFFTADQNVNNIAIELGDSPVHFTQLAISNHKPTHWQQVLFQERLMVTGSEDIRIRKRAWEVGAAGGNVARL